MKYITTQKYSECQLIAAINAFYFYGGQRITEEEYEKLVDLVGARYGSAIKVDLAYEKLGLKTFRIPPVGLLLKVFLWLGFPVEVSMWQENLGYHTVLIVDIDKEKGLLVPNVRTTQTNWVKWKKLKNAIKKGTRRNVSPSHGWFRVVKKI